PPSTTITSCPAERTGSSAASVPTMRRASFRAGTTIETRIARRYTRALRERAAAARSLSCGAPVAVIGDGDRRACQLFREKVGQGASRLARRDQRNAEHLVEIAIVEVAAVVDRYERPAHDVVEVRGIVRRMEQRHVGCELALAHERRAEAVDRHVGER